MGVGVGATPAAVQPPATPVPRAAVPAGFRAVDATFVSAQQGWVLVTDPDGGHAQPLRTRDRGQHFGALPPIGAQVDQLRFADSNDGFASSDQFPLLRVTHDAGATWNAVPVPGPVLALEPGPARCGCSPVRWLRCRQPVTWRSSCTAATSTCSPTSTSEAPTGQCC